MLFSSGFDMEPASGAKPANAVVCQGWKHFFMLNLSILYVYTDFTHLFHISPENSLNVYPS